MDEFPPEFSLFLSNATEPSTSGEFALPQLFRFRQYNEPIVFKNLLGSGEEGDVLEAAICGKTYAVKVVRLTARSNFPCSNSFV